jgi:hypothetical protein
MKMGTIASPWRYDTVRLDVMRFANLRMGRHVPFAFAAPSLCSQWQF